MGENRVKGVSGDGQGSLGRSVIVLLCAVGIYGITEVAEALVPLSGFESLGKRLARIKEGVDPNDFCFAVVGDSKNDERVFPRVLESISKDPAISFVIFTGDAVQSSREVFYRDLVKTVTTYLSKPIVFVPGNHDVPEHGEDGLYERVCGPRHYSFRIGTTRFVMADSNRMTSDAERGWLQGALSVGHADDKTIVVMHHPLYDPRGGEQHHCLDRHVADTLRVMFATYHVLHVYAGHIHGYWAGRWGPIPYTISGGGGARLYSDDPTHGFHHYVKVRIRGGRIREKPVVVKGTTCSRAIGSCGYYAQVETWELLVVLVIVASAVESGRKWVMR